jgi:SAM-dependent methyltransferase
MVNSGKQPYDNYFALRSISKEYYTTFKLPSYIERNLPLDKMARILDIGCGFGQLLREVVNKGYYNAEGVDISNEAIEFCNTSKLNAFLIDDLASYCNTSSNKYDFIIMCHVLEHIPKDNIIDTLVNIKNSLMSENASLLIVCPNAQSNTGCYWAYEDFTHQTLFTAGSLIFVLKAAGFKSIEFMDKYGTDGTRFGIKYLKLFLLSIYILNVKFWNYITASSFHQPSPQIFTYDVKVLAK